MNPVPKIREDYVAARFAALDEFEAEVRSARAELCTKVGLAERRLDAAVEDAWAAYHASPLPRQEASAALHESLDAAEAEYAVIEAEALRVCAARVDPARAEHAATMTKLTAARDRALEAL